LKQFVIKALSRSGLVSKKLGARADSYILMFHGFGAWDMPAAEFRRMLQALGKTHVFKRMDEIMGHDPAAGGRPSIYLTFDDGLRNQLEVAYPILRELSVPATLYVCPGLVESGEWIWTWELRARINSMAPNEVARIANELGASAQDVDAIMACLRDLPAAERKEAAAQVRRASGFFRPDHRQSQRFDLMDWTELRQLDPRLILIGSHSMTHAMLDSATPDEAVAEVVDSRKLLESKLDRAVEHFCYPNGRFGPVAESKVRQTYLSAVTTQNEALPGQITDLHRLPRIGAPEEADMVSWKLLRTARSSLAGA
jgi:peptidoglycan/xylan/chitin deacetylase (PgdA/CDA1 family)